MTDVQEMADVIGTLTEHALTVSVVTGPAARSHGFSYGYVIKDETANTTLRTLQNLSDVCLFLQGLAVGASLNDFMKGITDE